MRRTLYYFYGVQSAPHTPLTDDGSARPLLRNGAAQLRGTPLGCLRQNQQQGRRIDHPYAGTAQRAGR
ncbi:MAG TPA: hypothetical protein VLM83_02230 [Anaerolineales bacterium]|nr:hypothetical protein [Anaerolineales bacterium]